MKHVIAFDISMGKSYMVIYNAHKQCIFEQELKHSKPAFEELQKRFLSLQTKQVNHLQSYLKPQVFILDS